MKRILLSVATLALVSSANGADNPKKPKMMALGPVHSTSGIVVPKSSFTTAVKSVFIEKDQTYDGNSKIMDQTRKKMDIQRYNFIFRYGLGHGFDFRFLVPLFNKKMSMYNPKAKTNGEFENTGTGDMRVFMRYQITSQKKGDSFFSAIDIGLELPTGDTDEDFHLDNGKKLPKHKPYGMQLGDGSIDPILGISATKLMKRHRFDTSAMYFFNQKGDNDFQKGDQLNYALGYSYMLHPKIMPSFELNGKYFGKNKIKDNSVENSGGHELFLTPGLTSHLTKNLKILAGYSFPIYRDMNKGALGTKSLITLKLVYKW